MFDVVVYFHICLLYLSDVLLVILYVFFFKQKTAYEMRISDWSSDVCSSDLHFFRRFNLLGRRHALLLQQVEHQVAPLEGALRMTPRVVGGRPLNHARQQRHLMQLEPIGRAPCSEGVCKYV